MAEQKAEKEQHRQEREICRIPASVNDQWNFLLKMILDQMIHLVIQFEGAVDLLTLGQAVMEALAAEALTTAKFSWVTPPFSNLRSPSPIPPLGMSTQPHIRTSPFPASLDHRSIP